MKRILLFWFLILFSFQLQAQTDKTSIVLSENAKLIVERKKFVPELNVIEYYDEGKFVRSINGLYSFGTDGELPQFILSKANLIINGLSYELQVDNMYNPYFGNGERAGLHKDFLRLIREGKNYKLQAIFSDGAGSYGAEWLLVGKTSLRTILTYDEDIIIGYIQMNQK